MPDSTSRLSLPYPLGTDDVTAYPPVSASQMGILDDAVTASEGALVDRPSAGTFDVEYYATDTAQFFKDTGSAWVPMLSLQTVSKTSNADVAGGTIVQANGGSNLVMTLPTPATNVVCGVRNGTGILTLTVAASSGKIYGTGLSSSGASSIQLNSFGATALFVADGSNFNIVALNPPATFTVCTATYSGDVITTTTSASKVPLNNNATVDPGDHFDTTVHFQYNVPSYGFYDVTGLFAAYSSAANQNVEALIYQNGSPVATGYSPYATASVQVLAAQVGPIILQCSKGDTLQLWQQASTSDLLADAVTPYLSVKLVG